MDREERKGIPTSFSQFSFKLFGLSLVLLVIRIDFKSKGKGNDWKLSHKITVAWPGGRPRSSGGPCKFLPQVDKVSIANNLPHSQLADKVEESFYCRRVKNWQAWGWGCANGYCLLYLSRCHMGMKRGEMPFLHLICWLNSYYVLGTVPSILHTLSNFMPIAGNQARVLLSPSWRKERKLKGAEHLAERAAAVALPWGQPLGLHRLSSLIACERLQGWPSTKTFWAPEWYAGVTHLSF